MSELGLFILIILGVIYFFSNIVIGTHYQVEHSYDNDYFKKYNKFGIFFIVTFGWIGYLCAMIIEGDHKKLNKLLLKKENK